MGLLVRLTKANFGIVVPIDAGTVDIDETDLTLPFHETVALLVGSILIYMDHLKIDSWGQDMNR